MNLLIRFILPVFLVLISGYTQAHADLHWKKGYYVPATSTQSSEAEIETFETFEETELEEESENDEQTHSLQRPAEKNSSNFIEAASIDWLYSPIHEALYCQEDLCITTGRHILYRVIRI